jgi:uncharacterized protein
MQMNETITVGNQFTQYSAGSVSVKNQEYKSNIMVTNDRVVDFPIEDIKQIKLEDLNLVIEFMPDLIIFGTGDKVIYPDLKLIQNLQQKGIGVEVMPIQAVCRTFNFLVGEDRRVASILLF